MTTPAPIIALRPDAEPVGPVLSAIVDQVLVVSLRNSIARRNYITDLFDHHEITNWTFFDAIPADDPKVDAAYRDNKVRAWPGCFRCGDLVCTNRACNNLLISPQVGNFLTYLKLWRYAQDRPGAFLVVEDDVVFHPYATKPLAHLAGLIDKGDFALSPDTPRLVRMGWAKGADHDEPVAAPELRDDERMANPCHLITSAFARNLLERFSGEIETTSDVFLHHIAPAAGEALSLFPPIASELSWSTGAVASLIHPKPLHIKFLESTGDAVAAARHAKEVEMGEARKHTALGKRFLRPSGWEKSHELQKPVKQDGSPLPWFTYGAIEALERIVRETDRVFEYGAGYSTLWWSAKAAHVTSVEHDSEWIATLSGELADNVRLVEIGPGGDGAPAAEALVQRYFNRNPRTEFPMAAERKVRRGLDDQSFVRYASEIMEAEGPFDIIVIDGMARRLCAEIAPACLAEDGLIVFDNTNRSDYLEGYKTLSEHGFIQIPFWGLVPGADFMTCTSIYGRNLERFRTSNFIGNHFGFPEY